MREHIYLLFCVCYVTYIDIVSPTWALNKLWPMLHSSQHVQLFFSVSSINMDTNTYQFDAFYVITSFMSLIYYLITVPSHFNAFHFTSVLLMCFSVQLMSFHMSSVHVISCNDRFHTNYGFIMIMIIIIILLLLLLLCTARSRRQSWPSSCWTSLSAQQHFTECQQPERRLQKKGKTSELVWFQCTWLYCMVCLSWTLDLFGVW